MDLNFHCVHGYWGEPEDFEKLAEELRLLLPESKFFFQNLLDKNKCFHRGELGFSNYIAPEKIASSINVYLGYSLGGRLLTQYFYKHQEELDDKTLFIGLSSGCGLSLESYKEERKKWEDQVLDRIHSSSIDEFASYWSSLSLFNESIERESLPTWEQKELYQYFDSFRLSEWGYFLNFIAENQRVKIILGEKDTKYRAFYKDVEHELVESAGHRLLLDAPQALAKSINAIIQKEVL